MTLKPNNMPGLTSPVVSRQESFLKKRMGESPPRQCKPNLIGTLEFDGYKQSCIL